jgi:DNA polymerase-3 subunit chi
MPRVNFYSLPQDNENARRQFACRLAEKLSRQGVALQLFTSSEEEAGELDRLLWSFSAESFVPHALADTAATAAVSVVVSWGNPAAHGTLLNLTDTLPPGHEGLDTISEFVLNENNAKTQSRELWNRYKQLGYELQHHQM